MKGYIKDIHIPPSDPVGIDGMGVIERGDPTAVIVVYGISKQEFQDLLEASNDAPDGSPEVLQVTVRRVELVNKSRIAWYRDSQHAEDVRGGLPTGADRHQPEARTDPPARRARRPLPRRKSPGGQVGDSGPGGREGVPGPGDPDPVGGSCCFGSQRPTPVAAPRKQKMWLSRLVAAGHDAGVWRPRDMERIRHELAA